MSTSNTKTAPKVANGADTSEAPSHTVLTQHATASEQQQKEQKQQHRHHQHQPQHHDGAATGSSGPASSSTAQHNILSGWDPEQIVSLVSAARATATDNQVTDASAAQLYEQARHALNNLPPNLGQIASTLGEFAAGFKRSDGVSEVHGVADLNRRRDHSRHRDQHNQDHHDYDHDHDHDHDHGTVEHPQKDELQDDKKHEVADETNAEYEAHHQDNQEGQQQLGQHGHDNAATAAAIAAMGSHAGHPISNSSQDIGYEDDVSKDASLEIGESSGKKTGNRQSRGPESERQRKDNHKEVERKRRAGINLAIQELQALVPNCDSKGVNKGDIIFKAAQYVRDLKSNEASNIEKWTLEKLLMDQAMNDLEALLNATRQEIKRLRSRLGKEADDIPREEDMRWDAQSGVTEVAASLAQHANGGALASQHPYLQPHEQENQHADVAFQSHALVVDDGEGIGALRDVAAAAAAAARVVAATTGDDSTTENKSAGATQSIHADLVNSANSKASSEVRENVEAVGVAAAAAAAVAGTSHQQARKLLLGEDVLETAVRHARPRYARAVDSASEEVRSGEGTGEPSDAGAAAPVRGSKRQKV